MEFQKLKLLSQHRGFRVAILLIAIFVLSALVPGKPLDPWGLINLSKFFQLIGALLLIQVLGVLLVKALGRRHGLLLMGFLAGLISSTALTVSLTRQASEPGQKIPAALLPLLSATLAMLIEALLFVYLGVGQFRWELVVIFSGPIIFLVAAIILLMGRHLSFAFKLENEKLIDVWGTLKLVIFIMGILAVSKVVQHLAGPAGLQVLTFIVSLFEIHGSVISNTQLFEAGDLQLASFGWLLVTSILATCVSKVFLVFVLAEKNFTKYVALSMTGLSVFLLLSGLLFQSLV